MKRFAILSLLIAAGAAANAQTFVDNARVRNVQPQYENITVPRQECTSQWVTEPRRGAAAGPMQEYGPALLGGVAGAALGRQVGKGSGRDAATVLGAVVGAYAGDQYANGNRWGQPAPAPVYEQREVQQCRTVNAVESRLAGYHVDYEYRGQNHTAFLREHPGNHLQVRVSVEPVLSAQR
ncbi:glycine zipper 2TM domain-containing protein [Ramlibacter sp. AN1015]|uniref:glycine zipper 2TM domain-containing protein n=1 Tax=Ramlibacter sp. AN1015 TaxID=3133428 RepID=UPI0030BB9C4F